MNTEQLQTLKQVTVHDLIYKINLTDRNLRDGEYFYRAKENLATAKTVKIEFNANLYLLGFPHYNTGKCLEVKENDTQALSNSMLLNVITSSFFSDFFKIMPRGVASFFQL